MFPTKHYVPILKAKEGEFGALRELPNASKERLTPLFEVVGIPWDFINDAEAKTIDNHLQNLGQKILDSFGTEREFFVDSDLIGNDRQMNNGVHHFEYLFNDFRGRNLRAIPVSGLDRSANYKQAVRRIIEVDHRGFCLRIESADFSQANLADRINADLALYGIQANETHLIVDLGSVIDSNVDLLLLTIVTFINNVLPHLNNWYSFTIAATGFPSDLSDIKAGTIDTVDRVEWTIWNRLLTSQVERRPSFGDYSIAHPEIVELDPRNMRVSASIRYTHNDYWLVLRGRWLRRFGFTQYRDLCAALIGRTEYSGAAFSWGDQYIADCASGAEGTGNLTTWRRVGNNHHFHKVIDQISNLP